MKPAVLKRQAFLVFYFVNNKVIIIPPNDLKIKIYFVISTSEPKSGGCSFITW